MDEDVKVQEVVDEVRASADDEKLKRVIETWYEKTRTDGMKLGAQFMCAAVYGAMQKHILQKANPSLRDYKRMSDDIAKVISVPLRKQETQQNDSDNAAEQSKQTEEEA